MIADGRKFTTKVTVYGIFNFYFYRWIQLTVIPWPVQSVTERTPKFFGHVGCELITRLITLTSLSRRQPVTIDY